MYYIKKDESGYINPSDYLDFFDEFNKKDMENYFFITRVAEYLNYFLDSTPTMYGNLDYERMSGFINGYCSAKSWNIEETDDFMTIVTQNGRKKFVFEKPPLPDSYHERIKENNRTLNALLNN